MDYFYLGTYIDQLKGTGYLWGGLLAIVLLTIFVFYHSNKKHHTSPRWVILFAVIVIELVLLLITWDFVEDFLLQKQRGEWFKGLLPVLLAALPAYLLWYWRDQNKLKDQHHVERELKIKEDNNAWENFIKYQQLAENYRESEGTRASAIFALGEYYERWGTKFPEQVNVFFRNYLDNFWNNVDEFKVYRDCEQVFLAKIEDEKNPALYETEKAALDEAVEKLSAVKLPEYIRAVHKVIFDKSHIKDKKKHNLVSYVQLDLSSFNFINAYLVYANFTNAQLLDANFTNAYLDYANFTNAYLVYANLTNATLLNANLTNAKLLDSNLTNAQLDYANLTNATLLNANFTNAQLLDANLTNAYLVDANLTNAMLDDANFTNAQLLDANLTNAMLGFCRPVTSLFNIIAYKIYRPAKLGFQFKIFRKPWENRTWFYWKLPFAIIIKYLDFMFIRWNFRPDFTDAKYNSREIDTGIDRKTTKFPDWLDPKKEGMIDISEDEPPPPPPPEKKEPDFAAIIDLIV